MLQNPTLSDQVTATSSSELLKSIRNYFSGRHFAEIDRCFDRFLRFSALSKRAADLKVLVAYGGGKDSTFALAITRLIQLMVAERFGHTFQLRVACNFHSGMTQAVLDNMHRAFNALGMYNDSACELLLVDRARVIPFTQTAVLTEQTRMLSRRSVLIVGHQTRGAGRPTFCNRCNLDLARFLDAMSRHDGGVDILITGDSSLEMGAYNAWIQQAATALQLSATSSSNKVLSQTAVVKELGITYSRAIGAEMPEFVDSAIQRCPRFFPLFKDITYRAEDHWTLLTAFLGFSFDDIAFSFSETDCGNPSLMAHIRGLVHERLRSSTYAAGVSEYVAFGISLMKRKQFPLCLIDLIEQRYRSASDISKMRHKMNEYASRAFGLSEEQLICMIYSPFTARALHLDEYLQRENHFLKAHRTAIVDILEGDSGHHEIEQSLVSLSGLDITALRFLYREVAVNPATALEEVNHTALSILFAGDPHKTRTNLVVGSNLPSDEWMSGR